MHDHKFTSSFERAAVNFVGRSFVQTLYCMHETYKSFSFTVYFYHYFMMSFSVCVLFGSLVNANVHNL